MTLALRKYCKFYISLRQNYKACGAYEPQSLIANLQKTAYVIHIAFCICSLLALGNAFLRRIFKFIEVFFFSLRHCVHGGEKTYDKKQSCFFCKKENSKIARHLEQVHGEEEEVKIALSYKRNDKRRKHQFEKLCRFGNFNHNMEVLERNEGELKVVRRPAPNTKVDPNDYLPCKFCHGFFLSDEIWRHAPKCPFKEDETTSSRGMKYAGVTGNMSPPKICPPSGQIS